MINALATADSSLLAFLISTVAGGDGELSQHTRPVRDHGADDPRPGDPGDGGQRGRCAAPYAAGAIDRTDRDVPSRGSA